MNKYQKKEPVRAEDKAAPSKEESPVAGLEKTAVAIFASGAGSNAQQIISYFKESERVAIKLIVCNKPEAGVLGIAEKEGISTLFIERERFFRGDSYLPLLQEAGIHFIVLAGFLWKVPLPIIQAYPERIINIHPALLPKFGGKGMWGLYVHKAVLEKGEKTSGITIHYVDEQYDNGDIIFQATCEVKEEDTPETLAKRVHALEHAYFSKVIEETIRKNKKMTVAPPGNSY